MGVRVTRRGGLVSEVINSARLGVKRPQAHVVHSESGRHLVPPRGQRRDAHEVRAHAVVGVPETDTEQSHQVGAHAVVGVPETDTEQSHQAGAHAVVCFPDTDREIISGGGSCRGRCSPNRMQTHHITFMPWYAFLKKSQHKQHKHGQAEPVLSAQSKQLQRWRLFLEQAYI